MTLDENGEKVSFNQFSTYVQKMGGFGGKRNSDKAKPPIPVPKRAPDATYTENTSIDQVDTACIDVDHRYNIKHAFSEWCKYKWPVDKLNN